MRELILAVTFRAPGNLSNGSLKTGVVAAVPAAGEGGFVGVRTSPSCGRHGRPYMLAGDYSLREWAKENHVENFRVEELFDPKTNLQAGSWYLHRALSHWQQERDPTPFALAEYNAGASRAQRWAGGEAAPPMAANSFRRNIDFP